MAHIRSTRIALSAGLIACALSLGACAKNPDGSFVPVTDAQVAAQIERVQTTARAVCGFVPAVATVVDILATFVPSAQPAVSTASTIANAICSRVTAKSLRRGATPTYRGVAIRGQFQ